jgi:hypothetical protein
MYVCGGGWGIIGLCMSAGGEEFNSRLGDCFAGEYSYTTSWEIFVIPFSCQFLFSFNFVLIFSFAF